MKQPSIKIGKPIERREQAFTLRRPESYEQNKKRREINEAVAMQKKLAANGIKTNLVIEVD